MSSPISLINCLICGKGVEEEKPLVNTENVEMFKRSFHCFCRLLNLSSEYNVVEEIIDDVISALGGAIHPSSELAFRLPCCCDCFQTLNEVHRLHQAIDDMKTAQMAHVEELKHSFRSSEPFTDHHDDFRMESWRQLVTCIQSHLVSNSIQTNDNIEGDLTSMELGVSPPSPKDPLGMEDEQKCDEMSVPFSPHHSCPWSPSSFSSSSSSNLEGEEEQIPAKKRKSTAKNSPAKKRVETKRRPENNDQEIPLSLRRSSRQKRMPAVLNNEEQLLASDGDTDSEKDFVTSAGSDYEEEDGSYIPEREDAVAKRKPATTSVVKRKRGGIRKLNNYFYRITEDTLLYKFTLVQVSPCATQLKCLEPGCSSQFQDQSSLHLFDKMTAHVDQHHLPNDGASGPTKACPFKDCKEEFPEAAPLRSHLLDHHKCTTVICEICWKPFGDRGDSRMTHKWFHRNDQEKLEVPTPRMVLLHTKRSKTSKHKWLLEVEIEKPEAVVTPPRWKVTKSEFFSKLSETLLLYKFTIIKIIPGKGFSCEEPECGAGVVAKGTDYQAFEAVKAHIETAHLEGDGGKLGYSRKDRSCPFCPEGNVQDGGFNGLSIREHLFTDHRSPPPFLCHCCWKPLTCVKNLRRHLRTHQSAEERSASGDQDHPAPQLENVKSTRTFVCGDCGKQFQRADCYYRHKRMHQPGELRDRWSCDKCPKKFTTGQALKIHTEKFHVAPEQNQLLICTICNKQYLWREKERFAVHVRSHSNDKPFVCDICGASFTGKDNLRIHLKGVHTDGKRHQCEFCEMNYKGAKNLRRHQLKNHRDKVAPPDPIKSNVRSIPPECRPGFIGPKVAFPCEICEKVFPLKCRLTQHLKKYHHGI